MSTESTPATAVQIHPAGQIHGTLLPPSSKYHTLRFLLAAFLAEGTSTIYYPAESDDSTVLLQACRALGAQINEQERHEGRPVLSVQGTAGVLCSPPDDTLEVGNAGAVARLLLGICALAPRPITLTTAYPQSLGRRPNADLLVALAQLGAEVQATHPAGTLPVTLGHGQLHGGPVTISGRQSSQYVSALLFLGPLLPQGLKIEITDGLTSASFVDLSIEILAEAGITIHTRQLHRRYNIPGGQRYRSGSYTVPGDYPSAAALLAALAVTGGSLTIKNLARTDPAGNAVLEAFAALGLTLSWQGQDLHACADRPLQGMQLDGSRVIDSVPVIAAAACFARTPSRIYNVANLHGKESDRIHDLASELQKSGCQITPLPDALEIWPGEAGSIRGGVDVAAHADHRLIQALAIVGLGCREPITIHGAQHIAKSYPQFFDDLKLLCRPA